MKLFIILSIVFLGAVFVVRWGKSVDDGMKQRRINDAENEGDWKTFWDLTKDE